MHIEPCYGLVLFFNRIISLKIQINQNKMNIIKSIINKLRRKPLLVKPVVTSSYATKLTDYEVNKMKELKSNTVRFTSGGGIGVGKECLVGDKWIDITDYNCW